MSSPTGGRTDVMLVERYITHVTLNALIVFVRSIIVSHKKFLKAVQVMWLSSGCTESEKRTAVRKWHREQISFQPLT